ncbi:DUF2285 domain-containing protein [Xanthobacter sediminis]|uniref:DUF2285 domain-containing protein n=1 Tax=Xanthobacter sediminis TaxID=3119926 RepID=UPI003727B00C
MEQTVLWSPRVNPAVVLLGPSPDFEPDTQTIVFDSISTVRESAEGVHAVVGRADHAFQLLFLPGSRRDTPMAALIPLDADMMGRVEVLTRFWRMVEGRPALTDTRFTAQQRRRLRTMMLAADGRADGASYRDIAFALYGERRVASEPWKTSSLRDQVIGLVKGGRALIGGGYLKLLHHRRRP